MKKLDGALYIDAKQRKKKRLCTTTLLQVRKMNVTKQILPFGFCFCFCFSQVLVKTVSEYPQTMYFWERGLKLENFPSFLQGDTVKRAKILPHKVVKLYRPDTFIQWGGGVGARTYPSPPQTHTTQTYVKFGDFAEQHLSLVSNKSHLK